MYFKSCGAGRKMGIGFSRIGIFGGVIEILASTQGPSKVATQIKSLRRNKQF